MGSNPINLAVRFLLEIAALTSIGIWGWRQGEGWSRYLFAVGLVIFVGVIWGVFAVPDDPSRSGSAPIPTLGIVRLLIELFVFALAVWAMHNIGNTKLSWIFCSLILVHYVISYDRILWLINH